MVEVPKYYDPLKAGSIDGTDTLPHDRAIRRALNSCYNARADPKIVSDKYRTILVAQLSFETTEDTVKDFFKEYGELRSVRLVRNIVTGISRGYAFVEFKRERDARAAVKDCLYTPKKIDGREILVDHERERVQKGWVPRRLGGGLGGRKESGQLRFGGPHRPFQQPLLAGRFKPRRAEHTHPRNQGHNQPSSHNYHKREGRSSRRQYHPRYPQQQHFYSGEHFSNKRRRAS